jgi:hypothetical protein
MLKDQHQCIHLLGETQVQQKINIVDNIWLKEVPQIYSQEVSKIVYKATTINYVEIDNKFKSIETNTILVFRNLQLWKNCFLYIAF